MAKSTSLTPEQRSQRARIAALARWAKESPGANAARGQAGLLERFRREVLDADPEIVEPELSRRAEAARRLHMQRLAFKSSRARTTGGDAA
ncbi:hypothetical protein LY13_003865 [Prauserella aidingensis]|uniref:hypothetical protein n=1 Tax=Prauserella aidingensis TaxID=387890 RepID=UPI0020A5D69E|nr:hypothetical protein [Prauserella aidingensis]MCP2255091.1 hypothetical protein [Prauserella aidingensis]